ncbi:MAG: hypothetical protein ACI4JC_00490 [Faecalibacterium sp.]
MTLEQRAKTKSALRHYEAAYQRTNAESKAWKQAIDEALEYYDRHDPVRSDLVRVRYFQHHKEADAIELLHIGRTTYQKAHLDILSTVAINAARRGVL